MNDAPRKGPSPQETGTASPPVGNVNVANLLTAKVVASEGVDLIAEVLGTAAGVGA